MTSRETFRVNSIHTDTALVLPNGERASLVVENGRLSRILSESGQVAELSWRDSGRGYDQAAVGDQSRGRSSGSPNSFSWRRLKSMGRRSLDGQEGSPGPEERRSVKLFSRLSRNSQTSADRTPRWLQDEERQDAFPQDSGSLRSLHTAPAKSGMQPGREPSAHSKGEMATILESNNVQGTTAAWNPTGTWLPPEMTGAASESAHHTPVSPSAANLQSKPLEEKLFMVNGVLYHGTPVEQPPPQFSGPAEAARGVEVHPSTLTAEQAASLNSRSTVPIVPQPAAQHNSFPAANGGYAPVTPSPKQERRAATAGYGEGRGVTQMVLPAQRDRGLAPWGQSAFVAPADSLLLAKGNANVNEVGKKKVKGFFRRLKSKFFPSSAAKQKLVYGQQAHTDVQSMAEIDSKARPYHEVTTRQRMESAPEMNGEYHSVPSRMGKESSAALAPTPSSIHSAASGRAAAQLDDVHSDSFGRRTASVPPQRPTYHQSVDPEEVEAVSSSRRRSRRPLDAADLQVDTAAAPPPPPLHSAPSKALPAADPALREGVVGPAHPPALNSAPMRQAAAGSEVPEPASAGIGGLVRQVSAHSQGLIRQLSAQSQGDEADPTHSAGWDRNNRRMTLDRWQKLQSAPTAPMKPMVLHKAQAEEPSSRESRLRGLRTQGPAPRRDVANVPQRSGMAGLWRKNFSEGTSGAEVDELLQVPSLQRLARQRVSELEIIETAEVFEIVWHIPLGNDGPRIKKADCYLKSGEVVEGTRRDARQGVLRSQLNFTAEGHVHIRALQGEPFAAVFHDRIKMSTGGHRLKIEQKFQLLAPGVQPIKYFSIWHRVER